MKSFYNKHKNEPCFVLGSGPSLHDAPVGVLKKHIVIAPNRSILKAPFAQYYFSYDFSGTLRTHWLTLKDLTCDLIINKSAGGFGSYELKTKIPVFDGINKSRIHYFEVERMGQLARLTIKLALLPSSAQGAVHFAHILGCSPIILLGCDCQYAGGIKHYTEIEGEPVDDWIKPEFKNFTKDWSGIKSGNTDGELSSIKNAWADMRNKNRGIKIINASKGGAISAFPRMTIKEALK